MDRVKEEVIEGDCTPWMDSVVVKLEPAWSMEEDSPDQPSAVYSTVQPMSDNTSWSLLSLKRDSVCQHCSAAFVLVSSLELHLASVHGEPLPFPDWTERNDRQKQEPAWSMEEDSPDQPSAVYSTAQPVYNNTSWSLLSLKRGRVCHCCSAAFVLVSSLELHLASVHGEPLPFPDWTESGDRQKAEGVKPTPPPSILTSSVDPKSDRSSALKPNRVCQRCPAAFVLFSSLKLHAQFVHREIIQAEPSVSTTADCCEVGHHGDGKEGEESSQKKTVQRQRNSVAEIGSGQRGGDNGKRRHVCDVCSKAFTKACHLKTHTLIHTGEKPFVCSVCGKDFTVASHLKTHQRLHTEERPYKCPHCEADFTQSSNLQVHIRAVHAGDRPYVCDVCEKAFSHTGTLETHKRIHTGEKPHVCSDCGKGFSQACHLRRHHLTHTRPGQLKKHIEKVHQ